MNTGIYGNHANYVPTKQKMAKRLKVSKVIEICSNHLKEEGPR